MFEVSEKIYSILNGNAALMLLATKISPILASQETMMPFVNFILTEDGPFSKEGNHDYTVAINCFADDYDQTLKIADAVKQAFIETPILTFQYINSKPDIQDGIIVTTSIYSFKN